MRIVVLVLFFLSGAAALAYQVAWTRSLGLVFGASHLAVATVLSVYMGGQALGGAVFGRRVDTTNRPLRLYGLLEIGVAISALVSLALMQAYPAIYRQMVRVSDHPGFLTAVRAGFSVVALALPTTLMGGTLPVLAATASRRQAGFTREVSFLYAFNTFGAVAGTLATGFFLLSSIGVTRTILVAAGVIAAVGIASLLLDRASAMVGTDSHASDIATRPTDLTLLSKRVTLVVVGISGFCALGYEVLWTRMLSLVVGTSVYSFTLMLTAFLVGIGLGSHAHGLLPSRRQERVVGRRHVLLLAGTQVGIGASALAVTVAMRYLPRFSGQLQDLLFAGGQPDFRMRLLATAVIAFAFMVVPAFFMGMAFPAANAIWSAGRTDPGRATGEVLVANTLGSILGPIATGFLLISWFGVERSLQMLVVLNVAAGLTAAASVASGRRWVVAAIPVLAATVLVIRGTLPDWGRVWNQKYFATFQNNVRAVTSEAQLQEMLRDTEVLFYREGVNETVSSIRAFGHQGFVVNGRTEASTSPMDVAVQRTLGHLPMLLHPDPKRVFVLGTGTGMTLGSTAVHPEVERIVLAEIEEAMLGVARTFERWNHGVLGDPRLQVVFNDGRNFLSTTNEKFDVISADPIHPWSGGAGYLYTVEYFRTVAARLDRGGIACQWLPIYELTPRDLATVVRTWNEAFPYVLVWMTYYDTVLIGSNEPIAVDEEAIARRLSAAPKVREDLELVRMGTSKNLLDFFLMGNVGARAFGSRGVVNTDDNLWLEFSAPASQGRTELPGVNVQALSRYRENLVEYLAVPEASREQARVRWSQGLETGRMFDQAHALFLLGRPAQQTVPIMRAVRSRDPDYGPLKFLEDEQAFRELGEPTLVAELLVPAVDARGQSPIRVSAVRQFVSREWVLMSFVDNERKVIFGQRYLDGPFSQLEERASRYASEVLAMLKAAADSATPGGAGQALPRSEMEALLQAAGRQQIGSIQLPAVR